MDKCWWHAAWGLCLLQLSLAQQQIDLNITCRFAGVFHVEKNGRYSISRTEAEDLCQAFNSTLPTMDQMLKALDLGFETCRYGFIQDNVVIPRITPNAICAANNTGVYILQSNTSHYDTYCFNASAPLEEDCTSVTDLPNSFDGPVTITIVNRDGTRYSKTGEYRTHQEDIDASNTIDVDVSSGSSSEKSTSEGYIFHTFLPTEHATGDEDESYFTRSTPSTIASTVHSNSHAATQKQNNWMWFWFGNSQSTTQTQEPTASTAGTESNTNPTGWEPKEENEDDTDKYPSFSGSGIDDDEDFISSTNVDRNSTIAHEENSTQEPQPPVNHHEYQDEEETPHATSTTWAAPSSTAEASATQQDLWFESGWLGKYSPTPTEDSHVTAGATDTDSSHSTTLQPAATPTTHVVEDLNRTGPLSVTTRKDNVTQPFVGLSSHFTSADIGQDVSFARSGGKDGRRGPSLPKDTATSLEGYTPHYPDTMENGTLTPLAPAKTGVFEETKVTVAADFYFNVDGSLPEGRDTSMDPRHGSNTVTYGSGSAGHSSGSQDGGANTTPLPGRRPQIPEWLIILASLLALALILAVCIAVNSRRRCGQKKKLVINSGNGKVEDRKTSELNGEASKSQEMVHLVNKEPSETPDQFMTADETRNLQNVDMKIGV
ncbi:CD44 antigen [Microtus ochrogaster]|uniref:CD44 antigen n=1 Tax=Microtus ochrogaster TaxID=79684 RepID=A0A8J6GUL6_MICOH|nr:CD44 antigen [Microtus ochrogaster]